MMLGARCLNTCQTYPQTEAAFGLCLWVTFCGCVLHVSRHQATSIKHAASSYYVTEAMRLSNYQTMEVHWSYSLKSLGVLSRLPPVIINFVQLPRSSLQAAENIAAVFGHSGATSGRDPRSGPSQSPLERTETRIDFRIQFMLRVRADVTWSVPTLTLPVDSPSVTRVPSDKPIWGQSYGDAVRTINCVRNRQGSHDMAHEPPSL